LVEIRWPVHKLRVNTSVGSTNLTAAEPTRPWLSVEPFVSRRQLALLMGVSIATVDRMVAEGMPSVTWGRRTRRFRPSIAIAWGAERGRAA
jgi:hypothetical protein